MDVRNIYDVPEFLAGYMTLDRQVRGLDGAAEWPVFRSMIPEVAQKRVLDLGCGVGWLSRLADQRGAVSVLGTDGSSKMLEHARAATPVDAAVEYRRADLGQLELPADSFDVVVSLPALHYVSDLHRPLTRSPQWCKPVAPWCSPSTIRSTAHRSPSNSR